MIDANHPAASWFLLVTAVFFAIIFALPLLFVPMRWARAFTWEVPKGEGLDLAIYLGRCLGAVAVAIVALVIGAVPDPQGNLWVFRLLIAAGVLLALVHVWGAVRKAQPKIETYEIFLYSGVAVAAWLFLRSLE